MPLTETSLIVKWCTTDRGIIKTVAKGARRPKSTFAGKLDLFYLSEIEVHPARSGDLHILKDLASINTRFGLRRNYLQTVAASYFVKMIDRVAEPETPIPELDDLLNRGLDYLDKTDFNLRALLHFEKQLASFLGIEDGQHDPEYLLQDHFGEFPKQRGELITRLEKLSGSDDKSSETET